MGQSEYPVQKNIKISKEHEEYVDENITNFSKFVREAIERDKKEPEQSTLKKWQKNHA